MSSPSSISPDLFLDCKGEPMRFYIRPSTAKAQLHKVITAGGGCLCRVQEPGAILLADSKTVLIDSSGQHYVSTQYIWDCVKKNQQLDEMNYRLSTTQKIQTRSLRSKEGAVGRMTYTAEEDEAILNYISKYQSEAGGNRVWQLIEKKKITSHSWQSMKDHYLKHLKNRQAKGKMGTLEVVPMCEAQEDFDKSHENKPDTLSGDDSAVVSGVAVDHAIKETPEQLMEVVDGDEIAITRPQTSGEHPQGRMVTMPEEEQTESSPKRSRLDADEGDVIQGISSPGTEQNNEVGGTPPKRRLGILDRAVREFRNSLLNEDGQPNLPQSDSKTEMFHEAVEPEEAGLTPRQKNKSVGSEYNGNVTAVSGKSTKTCDVKLSSCRSHLFLLEGESQEDDCSSASQEAGCAPPPMNAGERLVLGLTKDCGKNLLEVTKALLKSSGDITLAKYHLLQGTFPCPLWSQKEDELLLSANPISKCQLETRHGKESVSARLSFLQAE